MVRIADAPTRVALIIKLVARRNVYGFWLVPIDKARRSRPSSSCVRA